MKESKSDYCVKFFNKVAESILPADLFKRISDEVALLTEDLDMNYRADVLMHVVDNLKHPEIREERKQDLCTLFEWCLNKVVYSFDEDVEKSFSDIHWSDLESHLVSTIDNLPLNAFAVSFNCNYEDDEDVFDSMLVYRDYCLKDVKQSAGLFFVMYNTHLVEGRKVAIFPIGLSTNLEGYDIATIKDAYEANCRYFQRFRDNKQHRIKYKKLLTHIFPYILYLCSQNAEICQPLENKKIYSPIKKPEYIKHKYREVKQFVCGEQTGCRIRDFKKQQYERRSIGKGSMKSPHVRRAHYHRYWKGTGSDRHIEIKWIPPIYVHENLKGYIKSSKVRVKESY